MIPQSLKTERRHLRPLAQQDTENGQRLTGARDIASATSRILHPHWDATKETSLEAPPPDPEGRRESHITIMLDAGACPIGPSRGVYRGGA